METNSRKTQHVSSKTKTDEESNMTNSSKNKPGKGFLQQDTSLTDETSNLPTKVCNNEYGNASPCKNLIFSNDLGPSQSLDKAQDDVKETSSKMDAEAVDLANQLFVTNQNKKEIAKHLSQRDEFGQIVARKYMELFAFSHISLVESLRLLLKKLPLLGETQERERILNQFARRYKQCNSHFLDGDLDAIHTLVCAAALLNTDLHGHRVGGRRRMTCREFVNNLSGLCPHGGDFPQNLLKDLYRSIKKNSLPSCQTEEPNIPKATKKELTTATNGTVAEESTAVSRSQSLHQTIATKVSVHPEFQGDTVGRRIGAGRSSKAKTLPRKQGVLWKKSIIDSDGNRTAKRKRRWKLLVVGLQGLELHLAKNNSSDSTKVSLHHSLAEVEADNQSTKRNNAFRLSLADRSVALYQTSSKEERKAWVCSLNRNAALLSAAPLAAPVGSQLKFQRPLFPSAVSTLPLNKQLSGQQDQLESLCDQIDEHAKLCPPEDAIASQKQFYKEKLDYLRHEIHKYEVYTSSLANLVRSAAHNDLSGPSNGQTSPQRSLDTASLLSVSPSEPGHVTFDGSSVYFQNDISAGSVSDLHDAGAKKHHFSPLSGNLSLYPTTSLPNLQPRDKRRFQDSPKRFFFKKNSSLSESANSNLKSSERFASPLAESSNKNNSNVADLDLVSASSSYNKAELPCKSPTGRTQLTFQNSPSRAHFKPHQKDIWRHHAKEQSYPSSSLTGGTSFLSNKQPAIENRTLMRGRMRPSSEEDEVYPPPNALPSGNEKKPAYSTYL